jgi:hypothetical protein
MLIPDTGSTRTAWQPPLCLGDQQPAARPISCRFRTASERDAERPATVALREDEHCRSEREHANAEAACEPRRVAAGPRPWPSPS